MKKKKGRLTFGEKTIAYEIWIRQGHPKEQSRRQKKVGRNLSLQRNPCSGHAQELHMHGQRLTEAAWSLGILNIEAHSNCYCPHAKLAQTRVLGQTRVPALQSANEVSHHGMIIFQ